MNSDSFNCTWTLFMGAVVREEGVAAETLDSRVQWTGKWATK